MVYAAVYPLMAGRTRPHPRYRNEGSKHGFSSLYFPYEWRTGSAAPKVQAPRVLGMAVCSLRGQKTRFEQQQHGELNEKVTANQIKFGCGASAPGPGSRQRPRTANNPREAPSPRSSQLASDLFTAGRLSVTPRSYPSSGKRRRARPGSLLVAFRRRLHSATRQARLRTGWFVSAQACSVPVTRLGSSFGPRMSSLQRVMTEVQRTVRRSGQTNVCTEEDRHPEDSETRGFQLDVPLKHW